MNNFFRGCKQGFFLFKAVFIFFILFSFSSCVEKKMSINQAKQVTLTMAEKSFTPPPKRIDDILALLEAPGGNPKSKFLVNAKRTVEQEPSGKLKGDALAKFYFKRAKAAGVLGKERKTLDDMRTALQHAKGMKTKIEKEIIVYEFSAGNFNRALELAKKHFSPNESIWSYKQLIQCYVGAGKLDTARKLKNQAQQLYHKRKARKTRINDEIHFARINYYLLQSIGKYAEAEPYIRTAIEYCKKRPQYPQSTYWEKHKLGSNLFRQNRLFEAEIMARDLLKEAINKYGKNTTEVQWSVALLGGIRLNQGYIKDAEKLIALQIQIGKASGSYEGSRNMTYGRKFYGSVLTSQSKYSQALEQFDQIKTALIDENEYLYNKQFARSPDFILCLIKLNRIKEAMNIISPAYIYFADQMGQDHPYTLEMKGLRAMGNALESHDKEAIADFSEAVPYLVEKISNGNTNYIEKNRARVIVESYFDLLIKIFKQGREDQFGIDVASECFTLFEKINSGKVQKALTSSGARSAVSDPDLAEHIRRA